MLSDKHVIYYNHAHPDASRSVTAPHRLKKQMPRSCSLGSWDLGVFSIAFTAFLTPPPPPRPSHLKTVPLARGHAFTAF